MNSIQHTATLGSMRAKVDRSMSYTVNTPELASTEKIALMDLQNMVVEITIKPLDAPDATIVPVKETVSRKSQSNRLRSVIFVLWEKKRERNLPVPADFEQYYHQITEQLIEVVKDKISEVEG
jgi:hypothetical protein